MINNHTPAHQLSKICYVTILCSFSDSTCCFVEKDN